MRNALPLYVALLTASITSLSAQNVVTPPALIDVSFAFIADVHTSFDGFDDYEAIASYGEPTSLLTQEASGNQCIGEPNYIDLCDQTQEVRKLNALEFNDWPAGLRTTGPIKLAGVAIGGDLTDCGGGAISPKSWHGNQCSDYGTALNGEQLIAFQKLYDRYYGPKTDLKLDALKFLSGLNNPDATVLNYPIFPGLGNHDENEYDSGVMRSYIANWNPYNPNMPGIRITNSDPGSRSYSWDWGGVHLINAGAFVGSDDLDYTFSKSSLQWIENDLATYAADGRPVVIFQHFGFDDTKWGNWFLQANRENMMNAIKNYNVIGIFAGHNHAHLGSYQYPYQAWKASVPVSVPLSISPFSTLNILNDPTSALPLSVYDVFHPGAAFAENIALVHITNDRMDVTYADASTEFKPSTDTVSFVEPFTKDLVPTPQLASPIQAAGTLLDSSAAVISNQMSYLVTIGAGNYQVSRINKDGSQTVTSSGYSSLIGLPIQCWDGTLVPSPSGLVYVNGGALVAALSIDATGNLHTSWTSPLPFDADSMMAFQYKNISYLLINRTSDARSIVYRVNSESGGQSGGELTVVQDFQMDKLTDITALRNQPIGYGNGSRFVPFIDPQGMPRFVRYDPVIGTAEFFTVVDSAGAIDLNEVSIESTWAPNASIIQAFKLYDQSTAFFIVSNACQSKPLPTCSPESPYLIKKLLADAKSTEISWRGNLAVPSIHVISELYSSTPQKSVLLAVTSNPPATGLPGFSYLLGIHNAAR